MSQWPFVIAAYTVAIGVTLTLAVVNLAMMRRAERAVEALKRR